LLLLSVKSNTLHIILSSKIVKIIIVNAALRYLRALSTDTTSQLNILGHDGHTLGMDGTQVGIFKETHQISFSSFLEGQDSRSLETEIGLLLVDKQIGVRNN